MEDETHVGLDARLPHGIPHGPQSFQVGGGRLLYEDMLAGGGDGDDVRSVLVVGRADGDDVHVVAGQHLLQVIVRLSALDAPFSDPPLGTLQRTAAHRHHLGARVGLVGAGVLSRHPAGPPDAYTILGHSAPSWACA